MATEQPGESSVWAIAKAIWNGFTTGLSLLVVVVAILIVGVPAAVGGMPLTVLSGSMRPVYEPGDLIVVKPAEPHEIGIGDVITYQLRSGEPELVTHRVIERSSSTSGETIFITKGDANPSADEDPVRGVQVHGTVWYRIPLLGWINNWFSGQARQIVIPVVAGLLLLYAFWSVISGVREHRKKKFRGEESPLEDSAPSDECQAESL